MLIELYRRYNFPRQGYNLRLAGFRHEKPFSTDNSQLKFFIKSPSVFSLAPSISFPENGCLKVPRIRSRNAKIPQPDSQHQQITSYIITLGIRGSHLQWTFADTSLLSQIQKKESIFNSGLLSQNFLCLMSSRYDLKKTLALLRGQGTHFKQQAWGHPQLVPLY